MKGYKYLPLRNTESVVWFSNLIENNQLYLSKYYTLNDPMEGIYYTLIHAKRLEH